jgi:hypothetical protein
MKTPKIDFTKVATTMAGHAAGAALFTQVNKLKPMRAYDDPSKQAIKGAIVAALGYVGVPYITSMLGLSGKGAKADFAEAAGQGMGMVGTMILANSVIKPKNGNALFPTISGVEGIGEENDIQGLGMIYGDEDYVSGYESDPTLAGYEQNPMLAGELEEVL